MDNDFFSTNREKLLQQCKGPVVLTAFTPLQQSVDGAAPFLQEANFWYLTGIVEPDWQVIIAPEKAWLVAPTVSKVHKLFEGGISLEEAVEISGIDEVIDQKEARKVLAVLAESHQSVYGLGSDSYQKYYSFSANPAPAKLWRRLGRQFSEVRDVRPFLARLRAIKSPEEIAVIREAVNLTVDVFSEMKTQLPECRYEYEVEAGFTYAFRRQNAKHAYDPIVASGVNACTMHYMANTASLKQGELLLIDIGARRGAYAADITRTYAIGRPTERQRQVHHALAVAQREIIGLLRPGLGLRSYIEQSDEIMKDALGSLGLLQSEKDYRKYFPHAISHGLGVDVHDSLGGHKEFLPGMVLTVEPGIYVPEEGMGLRLEDNVLITDNGNENLSAALALEL